MVEDRTLIDEVLRKLETDLCNVEWVFQEVATNYAETLSKIDDPYLRERALDIQDVTKRVVRNLQGKAPKTFLALTEPHILVAHNLTPSDTATMNRERVLGIATDLGSRTSHTAIIARSLDIPAVVGLHDITAKLETGQEVLVDGTNGLLIVDPTPETLAYYGEVESRRVKVVAQLRELRETKSTTRDGRHIVLSANIELPGDVEAVAANGAEGIGLYRTEFLYLNRRTLPTEDEQYETYRKVAERVPPDPLIIRTFDLGGDKLAPGAVDVGDELNPFLGWRAIRFCLENIDIFKTQLRAILRASAVGNVKIMFPMISGLDELRRAMSVLNECKEELRAIEDRHRRKGGGRRDDRNSQRRHFRRHARARGRFLQHRHERPDSIRHRGRSHERTNRASLSADASGGAAFAQNDRRRRACEQHLGRRLRRDGRRYCAHSAAARSRHGRVERGRDACAAGETRGAKSRHSRVPATCRGRAQAPNACAEILARCLDVANERYGDLLG